MRAAQSIKDRFEAISLEIARVAIKANRSPSDIKLVVVTKTFGIDRIVEVLEAGAKDLGENYVEEASEKISQLQAHFPVTWHMIGHIQSRKTRQVCEWFDFIHSIDREKVARRLSDAAMSAGKRMPVLLECNVSGEESKFGFAAWDQSSWGMLAAVIVKLTEMPGIQIKGLMTMAPYFDNPVAARPYFERLRCLRDYLAKNIPHADFHELSMGMSQDFREAIQEGATILRIGTAIMGERT